MDAAGSVRHTQRMATPRSPKALHLDVLRLLRAHPLGLLAIPLLVHVPSEILLASVHTRDEWLAFSDTPYGMPDPYATTSYLSVYPYIGYAGTTVTDTFQSFLTFSGKGLSASAASHGMPPSMWMAA